MTRLLVMTTLALAACGTKGDTADTAGASFDAETQALIDELQSELADYPSWSQTADWTGAVATPGGTHGESVQIWWNTAAYDTVLAAAGGDMPEGAIIVKEGYTDDAGTSLNTITSMWKKDGDWFWMREQGSSVTSAGYGISECADCHAAGQDSVRAETW